jgi:archaemetzincin
MDEIAVVKETLRNELKIYRDHEIIYENMGTLPPKTMINRARNQYVSERILEYLASIQYREDVLIAIIKHDAYAYYYNFVFGHADPINRVCAVYTPRLESAERKTYLDRLAKEVLHEVGHILGLHHCNNESCVMNFSNNIIDVDRKKAYFCSRCRQLIYSKNT